MKIQVILGSTRQKRFGEQPAKWIVEKAKAKGFDVELLDLRDYPLPFFDEPIPPQALKGVYSNEIAQKWADKIAEADGYIFVVAEYNAGATGVLKNAIDYVYEGWVKKPVAFVGYGSVGGARAIQQLRTVVNHLQMVPLSAAVHISNFWNLLDEQGNLKTESFEKSADAMLDQLVWWTKTLKAAREETTKTTS